MRHCHSNSVAMCGSGSWRKLKHEGLSDALTASDIELKWSASISIHNSLGLTTFKEQLSDLYLQSTRGSGSIWCGDRLWCNGKLRT